MIAYSQEENNLNGLEDIIKENQNFILQDEIDYFKSHKINLNSTNIEELSNLPLFNMSSAKSLFNYLNNNKLEFDFNDLKLQTNFSDIQIQILQKCTFWGNSSKKNKENTVNYIIRSQNKLLDTINLNSNFKGNNLNLYQKLILNYDNFEFGTLLDKDEGERQINDFQCAYLKYKSNDISIIVGDYILENGLGGVLWNGIGLSKSLDLVDNIFKIGNGAKIYLSSIDFGFFRGISSSYKYNYDTSSKIKISLSYANTNRSSNFDSLNNNVTSIYTSGLYRTQNEIEKKYNLNEMMFSSNIEIKLNKLLFGASILNINYNKQISDNATNLINKSKGNLFSLYSNYEINNLNFYNEISSDNNANLALKFGCNFEISKISNVIYYRYYSKEFNSPLGYGFGEFSNFKNETGLYFGSKFEISKSLEFNFFIDIFNSIGNTYLLNTKVRGLDLASEMKYRLTPTLLLKFRLQSQEKTDGLIQNDFKTIFQKCKYSSRFDLIRNFDQFEISFRIEYNYIDFSNVLTNESGLLGYINLNYSLNSKINFGGRYSLYSTNSFKSAIWQFESVTPTLGFSQIMYGEGFRFFVYSKIKTLDILQFWIKYGLFESNIKDSKNIFQLKRESNINLQIDIKL